jgi:beta-phosphoglucomutase-like phosphatase (HAD superfamily)
MEELNIKSEETIIIEDSYNGIRAAYRAGAIPFMVPDMVAADEEMKKLSFEIFSDLDEVFEFIIKDRIKYV